MKVPKFQIFDKVFYTLPDIKKTGEIVGIITPDFVTSLYTNDQIKAFNSYDPLWKKSYLYVIKLDGKFKNPSDQYSTVPEYFITVTKEACLEHFGV